MSKQKPHPASSGFDEPATDEATGPNPDSHSEMEAGSPDELLRRAEEAEKRVLICQADLENFRRRKNRETADQIRYASLPLVENLLDVVDNLSRALESAGQDAEDPTSLHQGVEMVGDQLQTILANYGCTTIPAIGEPFDPNLHEAIRTQPDEAPSNTIIHEVQAGYKLHDRVVRPAKVIISSGPAAQ